MGVKTVAQLQPAPYNPRKITKDKLELLGRSIELDPGYCDVIVKRWETLTGKKAKKSRPYHKEK